MSFFKSSTGILVLVVVLVLIIGTFLFFKSADAPTELELMGQSYPEAGRTHIPDGTPASNYNSNPPTSGDHYVSPSPRGFFEQILPDEALVHNLEHGEIWISFKSSVDQATKDELRSIQARNNGRTIVTQRDANPQNICIASWTRLLCMDNLDVNTAEQFIRANVNKSPEPLAR